MGVKYRVMIQIKNLIHNYTDGTCALVGVDLEIADGEFVSIIGANGCGKSTLARHINGLLLPTSGQVIVDGMNTVDEDNIWTIRQKVGMVFQNPDNQIVAAVVEEDVAFGLENVGVPGLEICDRVTAALDEVGMLDYAKHAPHRLSGGQKQRVAIAGILALEPNCIIFDEPTAMLDPKGRRDVVATVLRLNREKHITVIYITHNMEEAMLADRVVVMDRGKIAFAGTPVDVFSQVERLQKLSLEAPFAARLQRELGHQGRMGSPVITNKELADILCP